MTAQPAGLFNLVAWKRSCRQHVSQRAAYRCECCGKYTPLTKAGQVDHVIPRKDLAARGIHPFDVSNLQWLCWSCHSKKTAAEWRGPDHKKAERPDRWNVRTKIAGRNKFLAMAGISLTPPLKPKPVHLNAQLKGTEPC